MTKKIILIKDTAAGSDRTAQFHSAFINALSSSGLTAQAQAVRAFDIGRYAQGIVVKILPAGIIYSNVAEADIPEIIEKSVKGNGRVDRIAAPETAKELRVVLRNCGRINPDSIEDYIRAGGYRALKKALTSMTPEQVIAEVKTSGLRGRGGGGFPTGLKWELTRKNKAERRYMVCNGDEGDPGAYMDRSVLEGDPHAVVEGMLLACYAIGADTGYFYVRAEYPLAIERIEKAIKACYEYGLLGKNILGTGFNCDMEIRLGAGAFVCGEETALMASIEGKRGYPRPRPPFPAQSGLWGMPTAINNVETLATIAQIIDKGGEWLAGIGHEKSKGTKVFALTGKVKNSGLVEVPMGTTLRQVVYDIGGGTFSGKPVKAVQTGGPSGGVIPVQYLDTPISYENLQKLGSIMGSGGLIVMDADDCMIDIAKFYLRFCVDESCGKCAPCRIGGYQMLGILERISKGDGKPEDMQKLRDLSLAMSKASLCGLGQTASNPVVSTLRYFEDEYREHIDGKRCHTGKCRSLVRYEIDQAKCKRCRMCQINCPAGAIAGDRDKGFIIDQSKCIKCGRCHAACKFNAVTTR